MQMQMQNGKINDVHFLHTLCSPLPISLQENYDGETIDFYAPIPRAAYSCQPFAAHAACNKIFALSYPDPRNGIPPPRFPRLTLLATPTSNSH